MVCRFATTAFGASDFVTLNRTGAERSGRYSQSTS